MHSKLRGCYGSEAIVASNALLPNDQFVFVPSHTVGARLSIHPYCCTKEILPRLDYRPLFPEYRLFTPDHWVRSIDYLFFLFFLTFLAHADLFLTTQGVESTKILIFTPSNDAHFLQNRLLVADLQLFSSGRSGRIVFRLCCSNFVADGLTKLMSSNFRKEERLCMYVEVWKLKATCRTILQSWPT